MCVVFYVDRQIRRLYHLCPCRGCRLFWLRYCHIKRVGCSHTDEMHVAADRVPFLNHMKESFNFYYFKVVSIIANYSSAARVDSLIGA